MIYLFVRLDKLTS